jgi:hypothetical protein
MIKKIKLPEIDGVLTNLYSLKLEIEKLLGGNSLYLFEKYYELFEGNIVIPLDNLLIVRHFKVLVSLLLIMSCHDSKDLDCAFNNYMNKFKNTN